MAKMVKGLIDHSSTYCKWAQAFWYRSCAILPVINLPRWWLAPNIFEFHVDTNLNEFSVCEHNPITNRTALLLWQISVRKLEVIIYHLSQPLDTINYPSLEMDCLRWNFLIIILDQNLLLWVTVCYSPWISANFSLNIGNWIIKPQEEEIDYQINELCRISSLWDFLIWLNFFTLIIQ